MAQSLYSVESFHAEHVWTRYGSGTPGVRPTALLMERGAASSGSDLLDILLQTKQRQIFAESAVPGDCSERCGTERQHSIA